MDTALCEHGHTDPMASCNQCSAREIEGSEQVMDTDNREIVEREIALMKRVSLEVARFKPYIGEAFDGLAVRLISMVREASQLVGERGPYPSQVAAWNDALEKAARIVESYNAAFADPECGCAPSDIRALKRDIAALNNTGGQSNPNDNKELVYVPRPKRRKR